MATKEGLNAPLHAAMLAAGNRFVKEKGREFFRDENGNYASYPVGYIRGPHRAENGSPRPWSFSVQGEEGWHQRSFTSREHWNGEGLMWALAESQSLTGVSHG